MQRGTISRIIDLVLPGCTFQLSIFITLLVFAPALVFAQGGLENPSANSAQSGIGVISGWYCNATTIEAVINNSITIQTAYGTIRTDTQGSCGDTNNGFGILVNWNNLGAGTHTLRMLADGRQFAQVTVTVATLGTDFLRGQSGAFTFTFAGKNLRIEWNESLQNFVIAEASSPGGGGSGGVGSNADLQALLGRWSFTYRILITFTDVFTFSEIRVVNGYTVIVGTNQYGRAIVVARTQDLIPGSILPHKFSLLSIGITLCEYYNFDQTGPNQIVGIYAFSRYTGGQCGQIASDIYALTGTRLSALTLVPSSVNQESEKMRMERSIVESTDRGSLQMALEEMGEMVIELEE